MTAHKLSYIHRFVPAEQTVNATTLLLLHGTGGDENDLLPLGRALAPLRRCSARAARFLKTACRGSFADLPSASSTRKT